MKLPLVIMGVAGAGKTCIGKILAENLNATFVDGDDYHPKQNIIKMKQGIPLNDEDRSIWLKDLNELLKKESKKGAKIILACSALKSMHRRMLSQNMLLSFVYLKIDRNTAIKRLEEREHHFFRPSLLDDQFQMLEEPQKAIIIDARDSIDQVLIKIDHIINSEQVKGVRS
jgi:carbohydrate kinase (thermoresistant glucokinase family)